VHNLSLEFGDGENGSPSPALPRSEVGKLKDIVDEGWKTFWSKDQICGFDADGKRIGTGVPRVTPKYLGHKFSLGKDYE
jgi:hypothetical protein